jgi:hypothetical protein
VLWLGAPPRKISVDLKEVVFHPAGDIDLACLPANWAASDELFTLFLEETHLCSFEEPELLPGLEIWFVGYPIGLLDTAYNL